MLIYYYSVVTAAKLLCTIADMLNPVTILDKNSISRSKEADVEFRMLGNLSRSHDCDDSSKLSGCKDANNPLPKCTGLPCRSEKVPRSSSPCSKRPRTHQGENSTSIARSDVDNAVPRKSRCNPTKCTSAGNDHVAYSFYFSFLSQHDNMKVVDGAMLDKKARDAHRHYVFVIRRAPAHRYVPVVMHSLKLWGLTLLHVV